MRQRRTFVFFWAEPWTIWNIFALQKPTVQVDEWLVAAEITPEGAINIESGLKVSVEMAMGGAEGFGRGQ